jgi:ADP-heptose:LPS heptosyltransferase
MGLGGHLTWTAVASAIFEEKKLPVLPIENSSICEFSSIFQNNKHFIYDVDSEHYPLNLSDPNFHYLVDHGDRVTFTAEDHIISHICKKIKLKNFKLKCHLFLTEEEKNNANNTIKGLPKNYITIEPFSKMSWMQSRAYSFKKWQNIINSLSQYNFVQIGAPECEKLENVIYLNGEMSFRETGAVIQNSQLFVSSEGGLGHLSNAFDTQSILVYTSYQNPKMTAYPTTHVIDIALYRDTILGYKNHELYNVETEKHDETEIIEKILEIL